MENQNTSSSKTTFYFFLLAMVFIITCFFSCSDYTELSSNNNVGMAKAIAIDSSNNVHIAGFSRIYIDNLPATYELTSWCNGISKVMDLEYYYFSMFHGNVINNHFYVTGAVGNASNTMNPCYWDNSNTTWYLQKSSYTTGNSYSLASDANNNIYTVGFVGDSSNGFYPCYWGSSTLHVLPCGSYKYGYATGVAIDKTSNTVYISGCVGSSDNNLVPCLWINGAIALLPLNSSRIYGFSKSITISSTKVLLVVGIEGSSSTNVYPCYWQGALSGIVSTNPSDITLSSGSEYFALNDSTISNSNTGYIVGSEGSSSDNQKPVLWVISSNTVSTNYLDVGTGEYTGTANSIACSGNDVYIVGGIDSTGPCYWKNGDRTRLSGSAICESVVGAKNKSEINERLFNIQKSELR
jgi:hypothetical protein